jgi:hypothetical protein
MTRHEPASPPRTEVGSRFPKPPDEVPASPPVEVPVVPERTPGPVREVPVPPNEIPRPAPEELPGPAERGPGRRAP